METENKKKYPKGVVLLLITLLNCSWVFNQEYLRFGYIMGEYLDFDHSGDSAHIKFDTDSVWYIDKPDKSILYLPNDTYFGEYALITDTAEHYQNNINTSFQLKLLLIPETEEYDLWFYHKYDFEENRDGGVIETSWDLGLTWQNIIFDSIINNNIGEKMNIYNELDSIASNPGKAGFTGLNSEGSTVVLGFWADSGLVGDTLLLRFTFTSDSNNAGNEGWLLDEFAFRGFGSGVEKNNFESEFKIFPNPARESINILSPRGIPVENIELYSLTGQLLKQKEHSNHMKLYYITPGFYLIRINNRFMKKVLIE